MARTTRTKRFARRATRAATRRRPETPRRSKPARPSEPGAKRRTVPRGAARSGKPSAKRPASGVARAPKASPQGAPAGSQRARAGRSAPATRPPPTGRWLVKTEPGAFGYADLEREGRTVWDGVANALARIHLRAMREGDLVLVYHTGAEKAVVGLARVAAGPRPPNPLPPDDLGAVVVDL